MNTGKLCHMRQRNIQNLSEVKVLDVSLSHVTQFAGIHLIPVILLAATVNSTKLSPPGVSELPLEPAVAKISPRPFYQSRLSQQPCK